MAIKSTFKWFVAFTGFVVFAFVAVSVKTAGQIRQTRFNVRSLANIFSQYYQLNGRYPATLSQLPKFYVASAIEKLYFDSGQLAEGPNHGYQYDYNALGEGRFVLSASPRRLWPNSIEFGITESGNLKSNNRGVDSLSDTYEEVNSWPLAGF